jgi:hypothetical protein
MLARHPREVSPYSADGFRQRRAVIKASRKARNECALLGGQ